MGSNFPSHSCKNRGGRPISPPKWEAEKSAKTISPLHYQHAATLSNVRDAAWQRWRPGSIIIPRQCNIRGWVEKFARTNRGHRGQCSWLQASGMKPTNRPIVHAPRLCTSPYRIPTPPLLVPLEGSVFGRKEKKKNHFRRFKRDLSWDLTFFFFVFSRC